MNDDGSAGEFNDVVCTGIEEKMGIHGSATCSLTFGEKGTCKGSFLGQENKGMKAMFVMMNEARLQVGMQGLACASSLYLYAVNYARERIQGKVWMEKNRDRAFCCGGGGLMLIYEPEEEQRMGVFRFQMVTEAGVNGIVTS